MTEWEKQFVSGYKRGVQGYRLPKADGLHEAYVRGVNAGYAVKCWIDNTLLTGEHSE